MIECARADSIPVMGQFLGNLHTVVGGLYRMEKDVDSGKAEKELAVELIRTPKMIG